MKRRRFRTVPEEAPLHMDSGHSLLHRGCRRQTESDENHRLRVSSEAKLAINRFLLERARFLADNIEAMASKALALESDE
jgi:hypothetical protein